MKAGLCLLLFLTGGCVSGSTILTILPPEEGEAVGGVAVISSAQGELRLKPRTRGAVGGVAATSSVNEVTLYDQVGQSNHTKSKSGAKSLSADKIATLLSILPMPPKPRKFKIFFRMDETSLQPGIVAEIRAELSRWPAAELFIEGHTDSIGDAELNDALSAARARAVADELRSYGFSVDNENVIGRGERASRESGDPDNYANELFRKVEVTVR